MKLRPYESKAVRDLLRLLRKHRRVVGVAPTGSGKTVIGAALIRKMRGKRVLWLAHRFELLDQARRELARAGVPRRDIGILSGVKKANETARVLVASVPMFREREVPDVDLIVVDEAHHVVAESYRTIVDARPKTPLLGLTATPQRLGGEPLGDVFAHLYSVAEPPELIAGGYLSGSRVYGVPREKARRLVRNAGKGREYSAKKLEKAMKRRPLMADIVKEWKRLARNERTIVYACTRKHGQELAARFKAANVASAYLDGETGPVERASILAQLRSGKIRVVVNVGVLTEGLDCPPVSCIVVARPTKSLALWRQMCGRGARPKPRGRRYLVLDHAGNVWRHRFPDDLVKWSLDGRAKVEGEPITIGPDREIVHDLTEQRGKLEVVIRTEEEKVAALERIRAVARQCGGGEKFVRGAMRIMFGEAA